MIVFTLCSLLFTAIISEKLQCTKISRFYLMDTYSRADYRNPVFPVSLYAFDSFGALSEGKHLGNSVANVVNEIINAKQRVTRSK